jgi:hypothetical protein
MKTATVKVNGQQGDVLFRKLDKLPEGNIKPVAKINNKIVIAHGESGHSHVLDVVDDDEAELVEIGERMLLTLDKPATVVHEEHGPIKLDTGIWEVGRVREYDYMAQMARNVMD